MKLTTGQREEREGLLFKTMVYYLDVNLQFTDTEKALIAKNGWENEPLCTAPVDDGFRTNWRVAYFYKPTSFRFRTVVMRQAFEEQLVRSAAALETMLQARSGSSAPPPLPSTKRGAPEAASDRAWEMHKLGNTTGAIKMLRDALTQWGDNAEVHFTLARILAREDVVKWKLGAADQSPEQAKEIVRQWRSGSYPPLVHATVAYRLAPGDEIFRKTVGNIWGCIGCALEKTGELDDAYEAWVHCQDAESDRSDGNATESEWRSAGVLTNMMSAVEAPSTLPDAARKARAQLYRERALRAHERNRPYASLCEGLADALDPSQG
jgi:tetratricopeptide (TPR) repeat protein